ncbi:hypothetical protein Glove_279g16 [Diversispora epigaea]|uniref:Uncharacterized protein n=1 Tax=Diversispora epigaea TaxID=1348612 RepID=A0A397I3K3_9GLOM|nr:hypothetical protein Glove_279g16 [Diversispora epigaea]
MGSVNAYGKISKVRFAKPSQTFDNKKILFATGTWDEERNNTLMLWGSKEIPLGLNNNHESSFELYPVAKVNHKGDIMEMRFIDDNILLTSSSEGYFNAFKCLPYITSEQEDSDFRIENYQIEHIIAHQFHHFSENKSAPATGIAIEPNSGNDPEIVSVGEDGRLVLFNLSKEMQCQIVDSADVSGIKTVAWPSTDLIITIGISGQLKLFDRRKPGNPSIFYDLSRPRDTFNCLAVNSSQVNQIAAGSSEGFVTIWDIKNLEEPVKRARPHDIHVNELIFHPHRPGFLFSCSEDGTIGIMDFGGSIGGNVRSEMYRENGLIRRYCHEGNDIAINSIDYNSQNKLLIGGGDGRNLLWTQFE